MFKGKVIALALVLSLTAGSLWAAFGSPLAGYIVKISEGGTGQTSAAAALAALGGVGLASPAFTGVPTAPTAAVDTNTTQIATTAYVITQAYLKSATAASTYATLASPTFTGTVTVPTVNVTSSVILPAAATVASAATTAIGAAASNTITISGTTTITAFDNVAAGTWRNVRFSGALTLTHNGTSLILPGGASIVTAAGDTAKFISEGGGNWRCYYYSKASGAPIQNAIPAGAVSAYAMNTCPVSWLEADGAAISRSTYATLFSAISTTHGAGDGSTTFNLPDLRGYFIRGWDHGRGIDTARTFASLQADDNKSHSHATYNRYLSSTYGGTRIAETTHATGSYRVDNDLPGNDPTDVSGSEGRPKNVALLYCIKY